VQDGANRLWRTWLEAHLWIEQPGGSGWWHITPRPDGSVGEFPLAAPLHLVTAYNPRGEDLPLDRNRARQAELADYLRSELIASVPSLGASPDGSWSEPGFALLDLDEARALDLARHFDQAAIYAWSAARLEVVGALHEGRAAVGWSLDEAPSPPRA
jgi:Protein of unknown function (DUF3293)